MRRLSIAAVTLTLLASRLTAQAKEYLYVGNTLGGDLSVIEIPAHRVVGSIPASVVGNSPDDVISSRDGRVLYISSGTSRSKAHRTTSRSRAMSVFSTSRSTTRGDSPSSIREPTPW
jgi:hypothetical protein